MRGNKLSCSVIVFPCFPLRIQGRRIYENFRNDKDKNKPKGMFQNSAGLNLKLYRSSMALTKGLCKILI